MLLLPLLLAILVPRRGQAAAAAESCPSKTDTTQGTTFNKCPNNAGNTFEVPFDDDSLGFLSGLSCHHATISAKTNGGGLVSVDSMVQLIVSYAPRGKSGGVSSEELLNVTHGGILDPQHTSIQSLKLDTGEYISSFAVGSWLWVTGFAANTSKGQSFSCGSLTAPDGSAADIAFSSYVAKSGNFFASMKGLQYNSRPSGNSICSIPAVYTLSFYEYPGGSRKPFLVLPKPLEANREKRVVDCQSRV